MTVKQLIKELLELPMDAQIDIGVQGKESWRYLKPAVTVDYENGSCAILAQREMEEVKEMEIWKYTYAYDAYMDGRMREDIQLFSTKENAFIYAEQNGKPRSEFEGNDIDGYCALNDVGEWDSEIFCISKVVLDKALNK